MNRLLRWTLFVPAALASFIVASMLSKLLNFIFVGATTTAGVHSISSILIDLGATVIGVAAYYLVGTKIAPKDGQNKALNILFVISMILGIFLLASNLFLLTSNASIMSIISSIVLIVSSIYIRKLLKEDLEKKN